MITERQLDIVRAVVNGYVLTGQPVGSAIIVERFLTTVSSATVRKEMSMLEQMGYLLSPHTSAGRVPTDKSIKLYVDEMISFYESTVDMYIEKEEIYRQANMQLERLLKFTAQQLAQASSNAGIVLAPQASMSVINRIELVSLSDNMALAVLVSKNGSIYQKKIQFEGVFSQEDLYKVSRFLNQVLKGYEISDIKEKGLSVIMDDSIDLGPLGDVAMQVAQSLIYTPPDQQVLIEGETVFYQKLLDEHPDKRLAEKLITSMEDKNFICNLLDGARKKERINSMIGIDLEGEHLDGVTVLSTSYSVGGRNIGTLGVIGTSRMPYEKVIQSLDYSSGVLSSVLKESNELEFTDELYNPGEKLTRVHDKLF